MALRKLLRDGNTPLHLACQVHRLSCIETLLRFGSNTGLRNKDGFTPVRSVHGSLYPLYLWPMRVPCFCSTQCMHGEWTKRGPATLYCVLQLGGSMGSCHRHLLSTASVSKSESGEYAHCSEGTRGARAGCGAKLVQQTMLCHLTLPI